MTYAEKTEVPFDRSINEIQALLRKRGAGQIFYGEDGGMFAVQFSLSDRMIRFRLPVTIPDSKRSRDQQRRSRARALLLVIKAKLESVDSSIETIEQAFLANVVMSDGFTVHERIAEQMRLEYKTGQPDAMGLLPPPENANG